MADATGEANKAPLRVAFDRRIKLEFHGARITSDGGLLAYGELDDALGLTALAASALAEGRRGTNIRHRLLGLLRQAVYGRLAGYEDVNDAARLARDPAMRAIIGREGLDRPAASTSQMGRFETEWLATEANLAALVALSGAWIDRRHQSSPDRPAGRVQRLSEAGICPRDAFRLTRDRRRSRVPGGSRAYLGNAGLDRGTANMSLRISNPLAGQLARELSALTGETITDAVINALRQRLARGATTPGSEDVSIRMVADIVVTGACCKPKLNVFAVGLNRKRITFFSQQRRAMELIYALHVTQRIKPGSVIAIIGAGAAGSTAAATAGLLGHKVYLFDTAQEILSLQRGCTTRLLHPHLYDWPAQSSRVKDAGLPILSWEAKIADQVVRDLSAKWDEIYDRCHGLLKFEPERHIRSMEPFNSQWRLVPSKGPAITQKFDFVILCTGFGRERGAIDGKPSPYWHVDPLHQQQQRGSDKALRVLVSGCGDGGLIDTLRSSITSFDHETTFYELVDFMEGMGIAAELQQIETEAVDFLAQMTLQNLCLEKRRKDLGDFLATRYARISCIDRLSSKLEKCRRTDRVVTLNGKDIDPYQLESAMMHRVLIAALQFNGIVQYEAGEIEAKDYEAHCGGNVNKVRFVGTPSREQSFDQVVIRHGTEPSPALGLLGGNFAIANDASSFDIPQQFSIASHPIAQKAREFGLQTRGEVKADSQAFLRLSELAQSIDRILMQRVRAARGMSRGYQIELYGLIINEHLEQHGFSVQGFIDNLEKLETRRSFSSEIMKPDMYVDIAEDFSKTIFRAADNVMLLEVTDPKLLWNCSCYNFNESGDYEPIPYRRGSCLIHGKLTGDHVHNLFRTKLVGFRTWGLNLLWRQYASLFPPAVDSVLLIRDLADAGALTSSHKSMLDIGCGTGYLGSVFIKTCPTLNSITFADWLLTPMLYALMNGGRAAEVGGRDLVMKGHLGISLHASMLAATPFDVVVCNPPYLPLTEDFPEVDEAGTVAGTTLLEELIQLAPDLAREVYVCFSSVAMPEAAAAAGQSRKLTRIGPARRLPFRNVLAFRDRRYVDALVKERRLEHDPDAEFPYWHSIQSYRIC